MAGIYIHIPFCATKCIYCDFFSVAVTAEKRSAYLAALSKEYDARLGELQGEEVGTLYIGGAGVEKSLPLQKMECRKHPSIEDEGLLQCICTEISAVPLRLLFCKTAACELTAPHTTTGTIRRPVT